MAFRGSKNFPDGELNRSLERLGLRFGADTNASTSQYRTEFRFDLPNAKNVGEALAIARDVAGNVSFAASAVQTEAGVVMSESAMRGDPSRRAALAELQFMLVDAHATATPGSESGIIERPTAADLQRFYRAWYRPERAILTVVGDIDPEGLEKNIAERFSDWTGEGPQGVKPAFRIPYLRGLEAHLHVEEGAPNRVTLSWIRPPLNRPVDALARKKLSIKGVALQIVNRRLSAMASSADHPFVSARAGEQDALRAATMTSLSAGYESGDWKKALTALAEVRLTLLKSSVTQAEIDSVVRAQKAAAQRQEAAAGTRTTSALAGGLSAVAAANEIPVSPAQSRAAVDGDLAQLTPEIVGLALKDMFDGDPLVFVSSRTALTESETTILDAYRAVSDGIQPVLASATSPAAAAWPYTAFGAAGRVWKPGRPPISASPPSALPTMSNCWCVRPSCASIKCWCRSSSAMAVWACPRTAPGQLASGRRGGGRLGRAVFTRNRHRAFRQILWLGIDPGRRRFRLGRSNKCPGFADPTAAVHGLHQGSRFPAGSF
jgi:zinc protease